MYADKEKVQLIRWKKIKLKRGNQKNASQDLLLKVIFLYHKKYSFTIKPGCINKRVAYIVWPAHGSLTGGGRNWRFSFIFIFQLQEFVILLQQTRIWRSTVIWIIDSFNKLAVSWCNNRVRPLACRLWTIDFFFHAFCGAGAWKLSTPCPASLLTIHSQH